jgi:NADH-quinone oxidoreductase subunit N
MLAYSSIAHAGFLLVGVVAFNETGFEAATFYVATYVFINMAAFLLIDLLAQQRNSSLTIQEFQRIRYHSTASQCRTHCRYDCPDGTCRQRWDLPPSSWLFRHCWKRIQTSGNPWLPALFGIGLLNAVISLFYYLRIPFLLYFRPAPDGPFIRHTVLSRPQLILAAVLTVPVLVSVFQT